MHYFKSSLRFLLSLSRSKLEVPYLKKANKGQYMNLRSHPKMRSPIGPHNSMSWSFRNFSSSTFLTEWQEKKGGKILKFKNIKIKPTRKHKGKLQPNLSGNYRNWVFKMQECLTDLGHKLLFLFFPFQTEQCLHKQKIIYNFNWFKIEFKPHVLWVLFKSKEKESHDTWDEIYAFQAPLPSRLDSSLF